MRLDPPHTPGRPFGESRNSPQRVPLRPVRQPPFHAIRLCAGITYTMGGIAIDARARVINERQRPIPGLFAAGSCTGGIEGGPAAGYVGGYMRALCFGLIAGDAVAHSIAGGREYDASR
jgi:fumarate reductase flavoprotein subunit